VGRPKQNLPRTFREPPRALAAGHAARARRKSLGLRGTLAIVLTAAIVTAVLSLTGTSSQAAMEARIDRHVTQLFAGISQHETTLGDAAAPVTMEIFLDLKDPDSRSWFLTDLPAIINAGVRPGTLKLEYHAYKTNTYSPQEFVREQTAALAAGAQNKLWNYIYTFYAQPRRAKEASEFEAYATNNFLEAVARQVPDLNIPHWQTDRHTGRREEQTTQEDQTARALDLHVTPSFRIGRTGAPLHNYTGHLILKYGEQHPIALPEASDIDKAIRELTDARKG
jgi:Thioredoxin